MKSNDESAHHCSNCSLPLKHLDQNGGFNPSPLPCQSCGESVESSRFVCQNCEVVFCDYCLNGDSDESSLPSSPSSSGEYMKAEKPMPSSIKRRKLAPTQIISTNSVHAMDTDLPPIPKYKAPSAKYVQGEDFAKVRTISEYLREKSIFGAIESPSDNRDHTAAVKKLYDFILKHVDPDNGEKMRDIAERFRDKDVTWGSVVRFSNNKIVWPEEDEFKIYDMCKKFEFDLIQQRVRSQNRFEKNIFTPFYSFN